MRKLHFKLCAYAAMFLALGLIVGLHYGYCPSKPMSVTMFAFISLASVAMAITVIGIVEHVIILGLINGLSLFLAFDMGLGQTSPTAMTVALIITFGVAAIIWFLSSRAPYVRS